MPKGRRRKVTFAFRLREDRTGRIVSRQVSEEGVQVANKRRTFLLFCARRCHFFAGSVLVYSDSP